MTNLTKVLAAGVFTGFLAVGGMSLASAQEDPTTSTTAPAQDDTSTTAPPDGSTTAPPDDGTTSDGSTDPNCPHGQDGTGGSSSSPSATSNAAVNA